MGPGTAWRRVHVVVVMIAVVASAIVALATASPAGAAVVGPEIFTADPTAVQFGKVPLHSTVTKTITLTVDSGYIVSTASGTGAAAPFGFFFDTCTGAFGPAVCNVQETFTPTATGVASGTVHIEECPTTSGLCIVLGVPVSGTGVTPQGFTATPSTINFGNVPLDTTVTQAVTMTVDTGYVLVGSSVVAPPFGFDFGNCVGDFGPAVCTLEQSFTPANTGLAYNTTTVTECPSAGGACLFTRIAASGRSGTTPSAVFSAGKTQLTFAQQRVGTKSVAQSVVIRNRGTGPLSFAQISISGDFLRSGGTCSTGSPVAAGQSCTVAVKFTPRTRGLRNGLLTFTDNSGTSPDSLALHGTGV